MSEEYEHGVRRFGAVNWVGLHALATREVLRFLAVWTQTIIAPLTTAALFLMIFGLAIGPNRGAVMGVPFIVFITPGILMMTVIQNAFANTSSSVLISKIQGNIVDTLMTPLNPLELLIGFLAGGIARGAVIAGLMLCGLWVLLGIGVTHPVLALAFTIIGACMLSAFGLIAGIIARKFDQLAAITNFIVTPLAFLSGTFYSVASLPAPLQAFSHFNPVFYLIDGMRFAILGISDSAPALSMTVSVFTTLLTGFAAWRMLATGYRLKP